MQLVALARCNDHPRRGALPDKRDTSRFSGGGYRNRPAVSFEVSAITAGVIKGSFIKPHEIDWAVLCSVNRTSTILIFRNASPTRVLEIAREPDINRLQVEGGEKIGYCREISSVGRDFIMRHYDAYGGVKPPPIDHQGIDDAFVEKASVVLYFYRGKWLPLTGAD